VSQLSHHWTYHDLVGAEYGAAGLLSLKLAIIVNNAGSMVGGGQQGCPPAGGQARVCMLRTLAGMATGQATAQPLRLLSISPPFAAPALPYRQIVYLIIIADVLCGVAPDYNGLITNLLGVHDPSGKQAGGGLEGAAEDLVGGPVGHGAGAEAGRRLPQC
jgi:hypothetical protein